MTALEESMALDLETSRRTFLKAVGGAALMSTTAAPQLVIPEPPGRKLGWAVVGLGRLAINQILPAFAKCERSRVTALVSGDPEKARKLAARYGVDPKNIYNYTN